MPDVFFRQWGPRTFAAYLDLGQRYPTFVGVEESREAAVEWGRIVLADSDGSLENRCGIGLLAACAAEPKTSDMGEFGCARRERANAQDRRTTRTPAGDRSLT